MVPLFSSATAGPAMEPFAPLLIVGPPRSGSSFLVEALFHAGFGGANEGHFLPLLAELDTLVQGWYAQARAMGLLAIPENTIAQIPEATVRDELATLFERLQARRLPPSGRWLDKTVRVEGIGALPFLLDRWPAAKAVYLMRDGVGNVTSAERYFDVAFDVACRNWTFCSDEWDRVRPVLRDGAVLVVDHDELVDAPGPTAARLAAHLGLDGAQSARLQAFVVNRTADWNRGRGRRAALGALGWPPERLAIFLSLCGRQMVAQGYCAQDEIDALLPAVMPDRTRLVHDAARVLQIDDPRWFQRAGDDWYIVPGRTTAATLVFEDVDVAGRHRLAGLLLLAHPAAQPVRVEFLVVTTDTGRLVLAASVELTPLQPVDLALDLRAPADRVDCIVRVARGIGARTNDHAWVRMEGLGFVT